MAVNPVLKISKRDDETEGDRTPKTSAGRHSKTYKSRDFLQFLTDGTQKGASYKQILYYQ